jgi:hypothetical protein
VVVRRAVIPVLLAALALFCAAQAPAAPPTLSQIVTALQAAPSYVDPAASLNASGKAQLRRIANSRKARVRLVLLSAVPSGARSESQTASAIRRALRFPGAVAVAFPDNVAVAGANTPKLRAAAAAARDKRRLAALVTFAVRYTPVTTKPKPKPNPVTTTTATTSTTGTESDDSGLAWWAYLLIALVVVMIVAGILLLRARRGGRGHRGTGLIEAARALALQRVQRLGRDLAESAMQVSERDDPAIAQHHRRAADAVAEVRSQLPELDGPPAFRQANEQLDEAEWHLGVAVAHLEGTAEPPRPESGHPARCFFDAEHGLATVEIPLELPGIRTVKVGVCAADAVKLSRGQDPDVGVVTVGRRSLPWAAAPTWFGGWGWGQDDLPALRYNGRAVFATSLRVDTLSGTPPLPDEDGDEVADRDDVPAGPQL